MAKFCGKCGARLDEATGLCPNCAPAQAIQEESKKEELKKEEPKKVESQKEKPKKEKKNRKRLTKKAKLLLIIGAAVIVLALVIGVLFALRDDGYEVPRVDVDEYFEENAMILNVIDAQKSADVLTEAEAYQMLMDRGFDQFPITTNYTMDGDYGAETEISENSDTKHPIYQTYYMNTEGDIWSVVIINGAIMADPVSYNHESGREVPVGLSETEDMMSYDAKENKFFHTIPNTTVLTVITVGRIDAMALEELTKGALDEL